MKSDLYRMFHIVRHILFGIIFIGVGMYLVIGQFLGYKIDFPGDSLNYIFGFIALVYGTMRIFMYKKY